MKFIKFIVLILILSGCTHVHIPENGSGEIDVAGYYRSGGEHSRVYRMVDSTGNTPREPRWVTVDSSGSRSVWFYLTPTTFRNDSIARNDGMVTTEYAGAATVLCAFDSSTSVTANDDTVDVIGELLYWDHITERYQPIATPASGDTTHIATDFKYRSNLNDGEWGISYVWNFRAGVDAVKLTFVANVATNAYKARAELRPTEDN